MPTNSALRNWWNRTSYHTTITMSLLLHLHSLSKCLVWVKKCCHVWLDQNFDPSLLTNKLWLIFMGMKQKKFLKKKSKWPTQKNWVFQNCQFSIFFSKISWIGPCVSTIRPHLHERGAIVRAVYHVRERRFISTWFKHPIVVCCYFYLAIVPNVHCCMSLP